MQEMSKILTVFRVFKRSSRWAYFRVMYARTKVKTGFLLFSVALLIIINTYSKEDDLPIDADKRNKTFSNYLRHIHDLYGDDLLVNTSKCQIPDINVWNNQILSLAGSFRPTSCDRNRKTIPLGGLTFVKKQVVVINETILKSSGLQLFDVKCCYHAIQRVVQSRTSYNKDADGKIEFSGTCYPMQNWETVPLSGFIKVTCKLKQFFRNENSYSAFHLLANFNSELKSETSDLRKKLEYWQKKEHIPRPPNVLLIGIDSTSRMNFERSMPMTIDVLKNTFGAVEMRGYTKVGENTFPNFVPLMTSYSEEELTDICYKSRWAALDDCPFLWKDFSARNYITAHIEDSPLIAIFNYMKTGFLKQPVDIYPRPWMQAVYDDLFSVECINSQRPDEVVLQYIVDLVELAESHGLPYFITVWITELSHDTMSNLQNMDGPMGNALLRLHEGDFSSNSVIIVMGDHGYRFLPVRRSISGWYEDKLPALWISLPDKIQKQDPRWMDALQQNSRQLTTPFEVHHALKDILNLGNTHGTSLNKTLEQKVAYSLFEKIPDRTCYEARIPYEYCPCAVPKEFNDLDIVKSAAEVALREVNKNPVSKGCVRLGLGDITAFAELVDSSEKDNSAYQLIIGFNATPGTAVEAMMSYNLKLKRFEIRNLLRTNKITNQFCVPCDIFSTWCYCKVDWWSLFNIYDVLKTCLI